MRQSIAITVIVGSLAFVLGMLFDLTIRDYPFLELDRQINIVELSTLLLTVFIAFLIPSTVTKIIDDNRGVKIFLVDELKELFKLVGEIKKTINDCYDVGILEPENKQHILLVFHESELKIDSIIQQTSEAFGSEANSINENLKILLFKYQDAITGGILMDANFIKIEEEFLRGSNTEYSKIETGLKTMIQALYKF